MNQPFNTKRFRGIRIHDIAANAIGARTPDQQNDDAQQIAELTDPVTGGLLPQDRLKRYEGGQSGK